MKPYLARVDMLKLVLGNIDFVGVGDAGGLRGSVAAGSVYLGLHTAPPGDAGDQTSYEAAYVGYARKALTRDAAHWDFTADGTAVLLADQAFPASTSQGGDARWWSVGVAAAGLGRVLYVGGLLNPISMASGEVPTIPAGEFVSEG